MYSNDGNLSPSSSKAITQQVYLHQTEEKKQAISNFMDKLID